MPDTILSTSEMPPYVILSQLYKLGVAIIPILQMRRPKHGEVTQPAKVMRSGTQVFSLWFPEPQARAGPAAGSRLGLLSSLFVLHGPIAGLGSGPLSCAVGH